MLDTPVDIAASVASLANGEHCRLDGMLKLQSDLDRYQLIIEATRPEVVVETGTLTGASAAWFAAHGMIVVTVDIGPRAVPGGVYSVVGSSIDPAVVEQVRSIVAGRTCMVSLDSDHTAAHVTKEIELYGPMVTPGCYLVVEDGIFGYALPELRTRHGCGPAGGSPLDAIERCLAGNPDWTRDLDIEGAFPTTHHPAGFWRRLGEED